jgi:FMN phosphatase YigB (HAD superfamily)
LVVAEHELVSLVDVDNTLLDNDRIISDLHSFLDREVGEQEASEYFQLFEELRIELGYADYLGALQRYRARHPHDSHVLCVSSYLIDYPFANRLYPGSLDALAALRTHGPVVIFTDGDAVFQPRKVERSGLFEDVDGNVLVYIHKEHNLDDVERRYPARRYLLVDDKLRILTSVKAVWGSRVTTVFVRQGHYALDPAILERYAAVDVTLERIGDLADAGLAGTVLAASSEHGSR